MALDDQAYDVEDDGEEVESALPVRRGRGRKRLLPRIKDDGYLDRLARASQFIKSYEAPQEPAAPQERGVWDALKTGISSTVGYEKLSVQSDPASQAKTIAEISSKQAPASPAQQEMQAEIAPYAKEAQDAQGITDNVIAWSKLVAKRAAQFAANPKEFAMMTAENLPNSAPGMAASIAGAAAGGAVAGPVGSVVGGIGAGFLGGYGVEQGSSFYELVTKEARARGLDDKDPAQLEPLIREKYDEFLNKSRLKGIGTAGTDAVLTRLTMGIGSIGEKALIKEARSIAAAAKAGTITAEEATAQLAKVAAKETARNTIPRKAARGAGMTAAEMAGESASEAAGQKLGYGEVDPLDVVDEGLLSFGQGAGMAATERVARPIMGREVGNVEQAIEAAKQSVLPTTPEPASQIHAQVRNMLDPESTRDAVFIAKGNEQAIPQDLPDNVFEVEKPWGTLLTTNHQKANQYNMAQQMSDGDIAALIGIPENKETAVTGPNSRVVQGRDEQGNVVAEAVTSDAGQGANEQAIASQVPAGGSMTTTTPEQAQAERAALAQQEDVAPGFHDQEQVQQLLQDVPEAEMDEQGNIIPVQAQPAAQAQPVAEPAAPAETQLEPATPQRPNLNTKEERYGAMIEELNTALSRDAGAEVRVDPTTVQLLDEQEHPVFSKLSKAVKQAFNVDLLLVNAPSTVIKDVTGKPVMHFPEGISLHGSRTIVINAAAQNRSIMNVVSHELSHQLRVEYPQIWQELARVALKRVDKAAAQLHAASLNEAGEVNPDVVNEEIVAEIVGEQMGQPDFWSEVMAGQDRPFVDTLVAVVNKLLNKLTAALTSAGFVTGTRDVQTIRFAIKSAFAQWEAAEKAAVQSAPIQQGATNVNTATETKAPAAEVPAADRAGEKTAAAGAVPEPIAKAKEKAKAKKKKVDAGDTGQDQGVTEKPVAEKAAADSTDANPKDEVAGTKQAAPDTKSKVDKGAATVLKKDFPYAKEAIDRAIAENRLDAAAIRKLLKDGYNGNSKLTGDAKKRDAEQNSVKNLNHDIDLVEARAEYDRKVAAGEITPRERRRLELEELMAKAERLKFDENSREKPELVNNEGKPWNKDDKYEPVAADYPVIVDSGDFGGLSPDMEGKLVQLNVKPDEFKQAVDEWADLFRDPEKKRVLVSSSPKSLDKAGPFITLEEAEQKLKEWEAEADRINKEHRQNYEKTIISFFDVSANMLEPWSRAGFNVIQIDIQKGIDILDIDPRTFLEDDDVGDVYGIFGFPPCTVFTSTLSRDWKEADLDGRTETAKELVMQVMRFVEYFKPTFWMMENPVGRIEQVAGLPSPRMVMSHSNFGTPKRKYTQLYGKFDAENIPLANVKPTGAMTDQAGGKSIKTMNLRSETPIDFAYAFFMANNPYTMKTAEQRLKEEFPGATGGISAALRDGMTEQEIHDVLDANYRWDDYGQEARDALAQAVIDRHEGKELSESERNEFDQYDEAAMEAQAERGSGSNEDEYSDEDYNEEPGPYDHLSADERIAMNAYGTVDRPLKFFSGMSAPKDFPRAFERNKSVGVSLKALSKPSIPKLAKELAAAEDAYLFVDSGAFSAPGEETDIDASTLNFKQVMERYADLTRAINDADDSGMAADRVFFVMPDVVGDQTASLALVARFKDAIKGNSLRNIIPLQKGPLRIKQAYEQMMRNLGLDPAKDASPIIGIPTAKQYAIPDDEFRELLEAYGDKMMGIHVLGALSDKMLEPRLKALRDNKFGINVSADANRLRAFLDSRRGIGRDLAMDMMLSEAVPNDERLLIIACSDKKKDGTHPAAELYTGALYEMLNKHMPKQRPEIYVISAKHGLVKGTELLEKYDQKMTPERMTELANEKVDLAKFEGKQFRDVFIAGSAQYASVAEAYVQQLQEAGVVSEDATVGATVGGIGEQRGQLGNYLRKIDRIGKKAELRYARQSPEYRTKELLQSIKEARALFRLPVSDKQTVEGIAHENVRGIKVKKLSQPGPAMYEFTLPDGQKATMAVRPFNKYGKTIYAYDLVDGEKLNEVTERPGKNAEAVDGKDDVWIDVSKLEPGSNYGPAIYNIAANYAYNTGKVFIGDPNGLSDMALQRRPELMLSSALKFGTTEHLAPHPHQIKGDPKLGVPGLDWVYGDDAGNIVKLMKVNVANIENNGGNGGIAYNKEKGQFEDYDGHVFTRGDLNLVAKAGIGRAAQAGGSTLARNAVWSSLLQGDGSSESQLLGAFVQLLRTHDPVHVGGPLHQLMYARRPVRDQEGAGSSTAARVTDPRLARAVTQTPEFKKWFGDSKVVDEQGNPLVVYHGTTKDFATFDKSTFGSRTDNGWLGEGFYFTSDPTNIDAYGNIGMPVYLHASNLYDMNGKNFSAILKEHGGPKAFSEWLRANGYDGATMWSQYMVLEPNQIKSATGNNGNFDASNPDIRFARQKELQGNKFNLSAETRWDRVRDLLQDRMNRARKVIDEVTAQPGGQVDEGSEFYKADERAAGSTASRIGWFQKFVVKKLINDMAKADVDINDVGLYMYALHAPARNKHIKSINPQIGDAGSGMSDSEAAALMIAFRSDPKYQQIVGFAKRLESVMDDTRKVLVQGGLVDAATVAAWKANLPNYVPLKGFENADENGVKTIGSGQGYDLRGAESRHALGRQSRAGQIVENIIRDHERAIVRAEKNKVARAFLKFVRMNPDDKLWGVNRMVLKPTLNKSMGQVLYRLEKLDDQERTIVAKEHGVEYAIVVNDAKLLQQLKGERGIFNYGEDAGRIFNGWALINRTLTKFWTSLNPVFVTTNFARDYLTAMINGGTKMGPAFSAKLTKYLFPAMKGIVQAERSDQPVTVPAGGPTTWAEWYQQYQEDGGKAGFYVFGDIEDKQRELNKLFDQAHKLTHGGMKAAWSKSLHFIRAAEDLIMDYNGGVENATRVAAYRAAIEAGKTRAEASSIAKNLTVNFNRKGVLSPALGSFFLFFNPSVQGVARIMSAARDNPKAFGALTGSLVGLGIMAAMMNAGDKDDEGMPYWDKVPEYEKEKNLILHTGGGNRVTVPLAYGYGWFVHLGYVVADIARGESIPAKSFELFKSFLQHYSPINNDNPLLLLTPTAIAPMVQHASNEKATGTPLRPNEQRMDGTPVPESERYWAATRGSTLERFTTWLNEQTGGNSAVPGAISLSPEVIKNYVTGYMGGAGSFVADMFNTAVTTSTLGFDVAAQQGEVPFLRQFYKFDNSKGDQQYFIRKSRDALQALNEAKMYYNSDKPMYLERIEKNRGLIALGTSVHDINLANSAIRKAEIQVFMDDTLSAKDKRDRLQELDAQKRDMWRKFNAQMKEIERNQ